MGAFVSTVRAHAAGLISVLMLLPQFALTAENSWAISWGDWAGSMSLPQGLVGVKAIGAGNTHYAAVLENGSVVTWGGCDACGFDALGNVSDASAVSVGFDHLLVL